MSQVVSRKCPAQLVDHHRSGVPPPGAAFVAQAISHEISPNIGIGFARWKDYRWSRFAVRPAQAWWLSLIKG